MFSAFGSSDAVGVQVSSLSFDFLAPSESFAANLKSHQ